MHGLSGGQIVCIIFRFFEYSRTFSVLCLSMRFGGRTHCISIWCVGDVQAVLKTRHGRTWDITVVGSVCCLCAQTHTLLCNKKRIKEADNCVAADRVSATTGVITLVLRRHHSLVWTSNHPLYHSRDVLFCLFVTSLSSSWPSWSARSHRWMEHT